MSLLSKVLDAATSAEYNKNGKSAKNAPSGRVAADRMDSLSEPLPEAEFRRILCHERKRSDRSRKSFLLMLVQHKEQGEVKPALERLIKPMAGVIRDTDTLGWLNSRGTLGVIFSELGSAEPGAAVESIESKVRSALLSSVHDQANALQISFYSYPQNWRGGADAIDPVMYPDLLDLNFGKKASLLFKRLIDVVGSGLALVLLCPLFGALAILIKATSKGPVFFRQQRLGRFQVPFSFLKFRSMYVSTDPEMHKTYVTDFIAGRAAPNPLSDGQRSVYKLTNDPRVTWIGKFMRRTSLDEIPQFWNVLVGEMSLVGPRPPIDYEIQAYDVWHRRRLLEAKPGITGLWQVHGRSRTTFDEMVRLDLRYARTCSPVSDLRILLQTPRAVLSGDGAY